MVKTLRKEKQMNGVLMAFLLGMLVALLIFLPFLIVDRGFFLYCGDFNSQQIPFYYYLHSFIREGAGSWSWATDLGSSAINSYSFYNLGSPFFWLSIPFPDSWMPFMMVPLLVLKFGCISAAACLWLSRYAKTRNMAVIVSLIYAFCGFNVYNIFFNHMLEPVIIFPLMLWALDGFFYDKQRGLFAVTVGLALLNSYFFFVGNVVFVILYFVVKVIFKEYIITLKELALAILEAIIGAGIGMALALPSFFNLMNNPRVDNFASGFGLIMYGKVQQYFAIIASAFLPPDSPYLPNIFTEGAIKWTSMSAYFPIVSIAGVAAFFKKRGWNAAKVLLLICFVMALVPIFNSSFYAFNSSYYARWYYMPLLIAAFATLRSLEDASIDLVFGSKVALVLTAGYVIFGLIPQQDEEGVWSMGLAQEAPKFWLTWLSAMLAVLVFFILVRYYRQRARFTALLLGAVMGFSVFYSVVHISLGKFPQWEKDSNYRSLMYEGSAQVDLPDYDDEFYRIDAYGTHDNLGMWMDKSCLQTFNSVVTPSIMEFYPNVGVKRDVSSKPETDRYALRGLLSVKYTLMPAEKRTEFENDATASRDWRFLKEEGGFAIYENDYFLPLGFTYDLYIGMDVLETVSENDRGEMLMRAMGLTQQQQEQYGYLFEGHVGEGYNPLGHDDYLANHSERYATSAYETSADASGFTVSIQLAEPELVFFSVPYDEGFSAYVNGVRAEVLNVSGGMMAVEAPAGENEIRFEYETPGFRAGAAISIASLAALMVYLVAILLVRTRRVQRQNELYEMDTESSDNKNDDLE